MSNLLGKSRNVSLSKSLNVNALRLSNSSSNVSNRQYVFVYFHSYDSLRIQECVTIKALKINPQNAKLKYNREKVLPPSILFSLQELPETLWTELICLIESVCCFISSVGKASTIYFFFHTILMSY